MLKYAFATAVRFSGALHRVTVVGNNFLLVQWVQKNAVRASMFEQACVCVCDAVYVCMCVAPRISGYLVFSFSA